MKWTVRTLGDLGADRVLAPERQLALARGADGVPLGDLVVERSERALPSDLVGSVVLDTTHAKDGLLDVRGAARDGAAVKSAKKLARAGDLLVSRLRPYLRQIAYVHPGALAIAGRDALFVSPEFFVLAPKDGPIAWLLPALLGADAQEALASAQEGGHHPRVPRASLLALPIPHAAVRGRVTATRAVESALAAHYRAARALSAVLG